jgi:hypothetical protein
LRRLITMSIAASAIALTAAGCGSSSSSDQLSTALSYVPKNSAVVVAINTDLNSDQAKQVGNLIKKIPQGSQILGAAKQSISRNGTDFDKDIKPLLGNDLVVAIPTAQALNQANSPTIEAIETKDGAKAKKAVSKNSTKVGTSHGADIYRDNSGGSLTAIKGDTLIGADNRALLDQALSYHDGSHMSKDDFDNALSGLEQNALVRGTANLQTIIAGSPGAAKARSIKWVAALRQLGFTAAAKSNAIAVDVQANTAGGLKDSDLPIASGDAAAPVINRPGEVNLGIRDPQQIYNFVISALQATNPQQFGQFTAGKQQIGSKLGVDIDKDIAGQLTGNAAVSVATAKQGFAARAALKDPAAFKTSLAKVAKGLPALAKQFGGGPVGVSVPKGGNGFYALASKGQKAVFAVVKNSFVVASDAGRAAQFAVQSPSQVPGAKGSVALSIDTKSLVDQQLQKQGANPLVQGFTGFLGDLTGYLNASTSKLRGNFTLQVK